MERVTRIFLMQTSLQTNCRWLENDVRSVPTANLIKNCEFVCGNIICSRRVTVLSYI